jgi:hypothetical protein
MYLRNKKHETSNSSTLEIWAEEKMNYPHVFEAANKWLSFSSTNVPGERLFSHSARIKTNLRSSIGPETFKSLLFLYENRNYIFDQ